MPMPPSTPPHADAPDFSALLQKETRAVASAYEREAYLVYNLALTISCDRAAARRAAERGFLDAVARDVDDPAVVPMTIAAALAEAPKSPDLPPAGDEHTGRVLAALSQLGSSERAVIAVQALCAADATAIGPLMGLTAEAGAALLDRARRALAAQLGIDESELDAQLDDVLWAAPPDAIWDSVFQQHYRATEERLRRGGAAPAEPDAGRRRWTAPVRFAAAGKWLAGTLAVAAIGIAATQLAANAGAGGAANGSGTDQGTAVAAEPGVIPPIDDTSSLPDESEAVVEASDTEQAPEPRKPLTAQQLDELRMAEIADLKRYAKRQTDQQLSPEERQEAAQEVERIRELADRRLAAAQRREDELRRQLALERLRARARARVRARMEAAAERERAAASTERKPTRERKPPAEKEATPPPKPTGTSETEEEPATTEQAGCLYNESDGTYLCPEDEG
jgi:hypothetical protein